MADFVTLLTEDHRRVEELFKQFEAPSAYVPSQFVAAMKKVESTVR